MCSSAQLADVPPFVLLPSIRNITIERAWIGIRNEVVNLMQEKFDEGLGHGYVPTNPAHQCVVNDQWTLV